MLCFAVGETIDEELLYFFGGDKLRNLPFVEIVQFRPEVLGEKLQERKSYSFKYKARRTTEVKIRDTTSLVKVTGIGAAIREGSSS